MAREDKAMIDLLMRQKPLSGYKAFWACADIKRAGSGMLVKKDIAVKSVRRSIVSLTGIDSQHPEGRVLLLEFAEMCLLNTYSQNNGWSPESMQKRRQWDHEVKQFLTNQAAVPRPKFSDADITGGGNTRTGGGGGGTASFGEGGNSGNSGNVVEDRGTLNLKPIIWTGDLNVCHREVDVSHPAFFLGQKPEGKKGGGAQPPPLPQHQDDRGQPGFTVNERRRFDDIVTSAGLTDAYRHLHGDKSSMTWYGHPGVTQVGKYRGKGMRLDYFMVSGHLRERIGECVQATDEIAEAEMAHRPDRAFFGSDHCAVFLRLKPKPVPVGAKTTTATTLGGAGEDGGAAVGGRGGEARESVGGEGGRNSEEGGVSDRHHREGAGSGASSKDAYEAFDRAGTP